MPPDNILLLAYDKDKGSEYVIFETSKVEKFLSDERSISIEAARQMLQDRPATYIGQTIITWEPEVPIAFLRNDSQVVEMRFGRALQTDNRYFWAISPVLTQEFNKQYAHLFSP